MEGGTKEIMEIVIFLLIVSVFFLYLGVFKLQVDINNLLKKQTEVNDSIAEIFNKIYDIMAYHNLITIEKEEKKDDNKNTTIVQK